MDSSDTENLSILSIFHYVVAGLAALLACFPILHLIMGFIVIFACLFGAESSTGRTDTPEAPVMFLIIGIMFIIIPLIIIFLGWAFAVCLVFAGRFLSKKIHYRFCLVMAGISCAFVPFGTVLGVFTILVLVKPSVKQLFDTAIQNRTTE